MADPVISEMIDLCTLMRTRLVSRVITGIYDQELRPFGINSAQFALLVIIARLEPATASEIGRVHRQDRSTLTRNLRIMMAEGWIEEDRDAASGRRRPIIVSKAGVDLLHAVAPAWHEGQAKARKLLGDEGVAVIANVANTILYPDRKA